MADEEIKTDAVNEETANQTSTESQAEVVTDASPEVTTDSAPAAEAEAPAPEEKPSETVKETASAEPVATATPAPKPTAEKHNLTHLIIVAVLALLVVGLGLWAWTLHSDNQSLKKQVTELNNNPLLIAQKKDKLATQDLVNKVGALMTLPKAEVPQAVLVTDAAEARKGNPVFYANAENGDKILVYTTAGKAILFRPSTNKIILVAPLTTSTTKQ